MHIVQQMLHNASMKAAAAAEAAVPRA